MSKIPLYSGIGIMAAGLLTIGIAVVPVVVGETNAKNTQDSAVSQLENQWGDPSVSEADIVSADPNSVDNLAELKEGEVFGLIKIPKLGKEWVKPLAQGTTPAVLDTMGVGHYVSTANPGQKGNFALAGHNNTNGSVFDRIPELEPGDEVIIETETMRYVYEFRSSEIVTPDTNEILYPVPWKAEAEPTEALLTMTTCWPAWSDKERWISYSVLKKAEEK